MRQSLAGRLLLATLAVVVVGAALLGFFQYYAGGQDALSSRAAASATGDVLRLQSLLGDIAGPLRLAAFAAAGAALAAAFVVVVAIDLRPPAGDVAAAKWRTLWVVLLFAVAGVAGVAAWQLIAPIEWELDPGHRTSAYIAVEIAAVFAYWLATLAGVRVTARVAVPLGDTLLNR